jgi:PAS domain S-box-containing protein
MVCQHSTISEKEFLESGALFPAYSEIRIETGFNLAGISTIKEVIKVLTDAALKVDSICFAILFLIDKKNKRLKMEGCHGLEQIPESLKNIPQNSSIYHLIFPKKPVYTNQLEPIGFKDIIDSSSFSQIGIVPIINQKNDIGSLIVGKKVPKTFTKNEKNILENFVMQMGGVISRIICQNKEEMRQRNFQNIFTNINDFIFIFNKKGEIIITNPIVEKVFGYSPRELKSMSFRNLFSPSATTDVNFLIQQMLNCEIERKILKLKTKDGKLITVEARLFEGKWDEKGVIYAIARDMSDQVLTESKLKQSEARWQFAFQCSGDGLWDWNIKTSYTFFSEQWKTMLGYLPDEINNSLNEWESRIHPDDREKTLSEIQKHLNGATAIYENEHRLRCKDGSYKWILDRGKIIERDGEGNPVRFIGTHTDISKQKQYEDSLQKALIHEKDLNELKSRFVSMASHEFRTPLASMLMASESLEHYYHRMTQEQREQKLSRIKTNIYFLRDVIERVLNLSHIQSGRMKFYPEKIDFERLVESVIDRHNALLNTTQTITFETRLKSKTEVLVDPQLVEQIMNNLISNSCKYSPDESEIHTSIEKKGRFVYFHISDQGIGIPQNEEKNIFDPFHRADNIGNVRGTGLGLSLSLEFAKKHKGDIYFKSNHPSPGTTFTVKLPVNFKNA